MPRRTRRSSSARPLAMGVGAVLVAVFVVVAVHRVDARTTTTSTAESAPLSSASAVISSATLTPRATQTSAHDSLKAVPVGKTRLVEVTIPATASHFKARPAYVLLPPAYSGSKHLPVIELLHGTPGGPTDWDTKGAAEQTESAFAAAHGGLAPIIVMPDINGTDRGDSECVDSPRGNVETYLTVDVRNYVITKLHSSASPQNWSIAGLSEGGTCSMMLALRHRTLYGSFADFSGLPSLTVTDSVDPAKTIPILFHGSTTAYDQHNPVWLMEHNAYPGLHGWFECGYNSASDLAAQNEVVRLARSAHLDVVARTVPGKHKWNVWTAAFSLALPWLWSHTAFG